MKALSRLVDDINRLNTLSVLVRARLAGLEGDALDVQLSECGNHLALYLGGRLRGVWITRSAALLWVPPAYLLPTLETHCLAQAVEFSVRQVFCVSRTRQECASFEWNSERHSAEFGSRNNVDQGQS
jgi:hypothetical protein